VKDSRYNEDGCLPASLPCGLTVCSRGVHAPSPTKCLRKQTSDNLLHTLKRGFPQLMRCPCGPRGIGVYCQAFVCCLAMLPAHLKTTKTFMSIVTLRVVAAAIETVWPPQPSTSYLTGRSMSIGEIRSIAAPPTGSHPTPPILFTTVLGHLKMPTDRMRI
jgi:hypothetical protein